MRPKACKVQGSPALRVVQGGLRNGKEQRLLPVASSMFKRKEQRRRTKKERGCWMFVPSAQTDRLLTLLQFIFLLYNFKEKAEEEANIGDT